MKVELHLHTMRYSACSTASAEQLVTAAREAGYGAMFLTEHDAVWSQEALADLQERFPEVRLFGGVELTVIDYTLHLLVLGTHDREYLGMARDPKAVIERARGEGLLTVLAHPFRWGGAPEMFESGAIPDALELRTANHQSEDALISLRYARELGLALVNAGDTHGLRMLDRFWIETARPLERGEDIRQIVLAGEYVNRSRENER